ELESVRPSTPVWRVGSVLDYLAGGILLVQGGRNVGSRQQQQRWSSSRGTDAGGQRGGTGGGRQELGTLHVLLRVPDRPGGGPSTPAAEIEAKIQEPEQLVRENTTRAIVANAAISVAKSDSGSGRWGGNIHSSRCSTSNVVRILRRGCGRCCHQRDPKVALEPRGRTRRPLALGERSVQGEGARTRRPGVSEDGCTGCCRAGGRCRSRAERQRDLERRYVVTGARPGRPPAVASGASCGLRSISSCLP
ncbi:unnamed protein product, partial [Ectocarpus fasciculatus]